MSNTIIELRHSSVTGNVPSSLANGEIAINTFDGKLFYRGGVSNTIQTIERFEGPAGLDTEIQFNDSGVLGASANLTFNKTTDVLSTKNIFVTGNLFPSVDNTGLVGNAANTWNNGQFTNLTIDSTLTVASLRGYSSLVGTASSATTTFVVTVVTKTSNHRYFGIGSALGYHIDGIESPFLTLLPGKTYRFTQEDGSNSTHQLLFYYTADKTTQYTTNVTTSGSAGSVGAYTEIVVTDTTPVILHYQCINHGYMGNAAQFNSNVVDTPYEIIARGGINVGGINVSSVLTSAFNQANVASIFANTPSHVANSASIYANGAFIKANTQDSINLTQNNSIEAAFSAANSSISTNLTQNNSITAAFITANSALVRANNSLDANTGGTVTANVTISANLTASNVATQTYIQFGDGTKQFTANAGLGGGGTVDDFARDTANAAFIQANAAFIAANTGGGGSANSFGQIVANGGTILATTANDSLQIIGESGISVSSNVAGKKIIVSVPAGFTFTTADYGFVNDDTNVIFDYGTL